VFRSIYKISIPVLVSLIFGFQIIFSSSETYAQSLIKINDVPGGGGGSSSQSQDTGGSSSTLLIVGGVIIAGILIYKLVIDKDEPKKGEKQDSTSKQSILLRDNADFASNMISDELRKMQEIPINIYLGFQIYDPVLPERKFVMGISCKF
jgi:hypothetical protein